MAQPTILIYRPVGVGQQAYQATIASGVTIDAGTFVGLDGSGEAHPANSGTDSQTAYAAVGWSQNGGIGDGQTPVSYFRDRLELTGFTALDETAGLFMGVQGDVTQTEPSASGEIAQTVGRVIAADRILLNINDAFTVVP